MTIWNKNLFIQINDTEYPFQLDLYSSTPSSINDVLHLKIPKPRFTFRNINRILGGYTKRKFVESRNKVAEELLNTLLDFPNFPPLFGPAMFLIVPIDEILYAPEKWSEISGSVLFFNDELEMITYNHTKTDPYELTRTLFTYSRDDFGKRVIKSVLPVILKSDKEEILNLVIDLPIENIVDLLNEIATNPRLEKYFSKLYEQNKLNDFCDMLIAATMPPDILKTLSTPVINTGSSLNIDYVLEGNVIFSKKDLPATAFLINE